MMCIDSDGLLILTSFSSAEARVPPPVFTDSTSTSSLKDPTWVKLMTAVEDIQKLQNENQKFNFQRETPLKLPCYCVFLHAHTYLLLLALFLFVYLFIYLFICICLYLSSYLIFIYLVFIVVFSPYYSFYLFYSSLF